MSLPPARRCRHEGVFATLTPCELVQDTWVGVEAGVWSPSGVWVFQDGAFDEFPVALQRVAVRGEFDQLHVRLDVTDVCATPLVVAAFGDDEGCLRIGRFGENAFDSTNDACGSDWDPAEWKHVAVAEEGWVSDELVDGDVLGSERVPVVCTHVVRSVVVIACD